MNKLTKLLSVFALAGAIGAGVAGAAGCAHKHTYEDKWTSGGADGHYHVATCHPEEHDDIKAHVYDNAQDTTCNDCGYTRTVTPGTETPGTEPPGTETPGTETPGTETPGTTTDDKVKAPAGLSALIVEEVGDASVQLSATKKSHTIDKAGIKVYYGTGDRTNPTKGGEVPAANIDLRLLDPANKTCESWEGLKANGTYTVIAKLKDVVSSTGAELNADQYPGTAKVTVINKATGIAVKAGATLTQDQSVVDSMTPTWSYEITRQNEDKEDVAAKDVTVGRVDHVRAGENKTANLTATVEDVKVTGAVTYTVNAVTGAVVQTTIAHANSVNAGDLSTKTEIGTDTGIFAKGSSSNKITVDSNVVSVDGKAFSQRLKLGGSALNNTSDRDKAVGDEISGLKDGRYFEFENLNATTTAGATSKTLITIYATTGSTGAVRKLTLYKVGADSKLTVAGTHSVNDQVKKYTYVVEDAATYRLASENSGCNVYYFQIDKLIIGEENAQDVNPTGDPTPVGIELDTSAATLVYKKDATISTEGVQVTFVKSNEATCDRTEEIVTTGITYSEVDTSKLGQKDVTVTYTDGTSNYTAKYTVTIESAVAGVWGATAKLSDAFDPQLPEGSAADAKLTIALEDLEAAITGNSTTAEAKVTAASYVVAGEDGDGTEITADGVELGKGTYTITATVTVTDGDDEATFEAEVALKITVKGELTEIDLTFGSMTVEEYGASGHQICDEDLATVTALEKVKVTANGATHPEDSTKTYTQRLQSAGSASATQKAIKIELKGKAQITVVYKTGTNRTMNIYHLDATDNNKWKSLQEVAYAGTGTYVHSFTALNADTYYLGGSNGIDFYEIIITPVND